MQTQLKDIYWLAGLIEGDGCFTVTKSHYPVVKIKMGDKDVVERAQRLFRPTKAHRPPPAYTKCQLGNKPYYVAGIAGRRAAGWMMTLYPLMGERRQARILEILTMWKRTATRKGRTET